MTERKVLHSGFQWRKKPLIDLTKKKRIQRKVGAIQAPRIKVMQDRDPELNIPGFQSLELTGTAPVEGSEQPELEVVDVKPYVVQHNHCPICNGCLISGDYHGRCVPLERYSHSIRFFKMFRPKTQGN